MNQADNLRSLAEVSVSLTGFTGIVVALGRRAGGEWSPLELLRLRMLLETSLAVLFLSLTPLLLRELGPSQTTLWRVSNVFQALVYVIGGWVLKGRVRELEEDQWPEEEKKLTALLVPIGAAFVIAQLAVGVGFLPDYATFSFLAGLIFLLALAAIHFVLLLIPQDS